MNTPSELKYTKTHEWVSFSDDNTARVGLTDYAQHALGDIVFVDLPDIGDEVVMEESFADVESVKAVSEVNSPVTGVISDVNEKLVDAPEAINEDPYDAWIIEINRFTDKIELMDADDYDVFCESEEA